jgi:beta-alanine degradation protein BauB
MQSDPTILAPRHVRVVLEHESVRVLRVRLGPGDQVPLHSHTSLVGVFVSTGQVRNSVPGRGHDDLNARPGDVFWSPPVTHTTDNISGEHVEMILVELKHPLQRGKGEPAIQEPPSTPWTVTG